MRTISLLMFLVIGLSAVADEPKPKDADLGTQPPEGAIVLFNGVDLLEWVKKDGKTPADWPVKDGILTIGVGKGDIMTAKTFHLIA